MKLRTILFIVIPLLLLLAIFSEEEESIEEAEPIPCTITGTQSGNKLTLELTYDGATVSNIKGMVGERSSFTAATTSKSANVKMKLPSKNSKANLSAQTFMSYTAVTAKNSDQYKLLNKSNATDAGIYRKIGDRYAIALGSYYGSKIGTKYTVHFKQKNGSKKVIQAVLGDQKADKDTDSKNQYHTVDGSVLEFVTAAGTSSQVSKTQQQINKDFGTITAIYKGNSANVKLKGKIKKKVTITGTVDGIPITAKGSVEDRKIQAKGYIGEKQNSQTGMYNGGKFAWPVPGNTRISSPYGWRQCPFHGREFHSGIDIPAPMGTSVVAAANGKVVSSGYQGSYGNCVIISHGNGLFTLYGHNSSLKVRNGEKVKKGQPIAGVGSTGSSTGNHLHFEVRKGGNSHGNHSSPWDYLKKK